ncbi:MAG: tRNA pseudouridine(55) synthase TruB [Bacteroidetes bacterium GWF2_33_16]|nr:MAG: tRNA pseudouridine(55) synthase TruB [Bacteroidetes bacterium GWE2_32_14]OFY07699.1 MAG: tRNA pseudouridine(55) synthase TruB [Bacteroidetes bacterium GWF2_33_16]
MFGVNDLNEFKEGLVIPINKPYDWTSFDAVRKVKNLILNKFRTTTGEKISKLKVGHAGTLDPLAEGLIILCTGKATKKIQELQDAPKEYVATIELGKTTPSFDLETLYDQEFPIEHITEKFVKDSLVSFIGEQEQVPPVYSAKNVNGKRAYDYARKGIELELKPSIITISEIELTKFNLPLIEIRIVCSKGTYIRSLAHDIGKTLNSGGHLVKLIRTKIGSYNVENSVTISEFEKILTTL